MAGQSPDRKRLRCILTAGKKWRNVRHYKTQTIQNSPCDDDSFEPGPGFIHCFAVAAEVHKEQRRGCGDDGGDRGYSKDLIVDILHNFRGLVPHITVCRKGGCGEDTDQRGR